ncbi:hypothetical protein [Mycolicibacterium peregrinum]|uniref:hypothetical protein n=1 Tax=Mycolicibacterium peregrinum TaxID=43304 RepID=UPI0013F4E620|nr:hypothetical protein [Mycolicibacterium peregrinum]
MSESVSEPSEAQDPAPQDISEPSTDAPADEPASVDPDTPEPRLTTDTWMGSQ